MNQADELIRQFTGAARNVAGRFSNSLPKAIQQDVDDLKQVAVIGLIDAARRFDPAYGVKFWTFALPRVTGKIKDYLRECDWVPRVSRQRDPHGQYRVQIPFSALTFGEERKVTEHAEACPVDNTSLSAEEILRLIPSGRQRDCVRLYYFDGLSMKELGARWNVSESRAYQIYRKAIIGARRKCGLSGPIPKIFKNKYQLKTGGRNGRDHRTQRAGQGQSRQAA